MKDEPTNVVSLRPSKPTDGWHSPIELIEELLADMKSGKIKSDGVIVIFHDITSANPKADLDMCPVWTMGFTALELLGVSVQLQRVVP